MVIIKNINIINNYYNNECENQTIYNTVFSPTGDRFAPSSSAAIMETKTQFPKKTKLPERSELLDQRGFKLTEMRKKPAVHQPIPIHKLSMTSTVWNTSTGLLVPSMWLCFLTAPAHLLLS